MTNKNFQGMESFKWFFGDVVSNLDPLKLGRIKIRPYGIYTNDIDEGDLPWAIVIQSTSSAGVAGIGTSPTGILDSSSVFGFFIDDDLQQPVILGTWAGFNDISPLAIEVNSIDKKYIGPEPHSTYKSVYPFNKVMTSSSGHVIEIDDSPDAERIHVYHKTGSYCDFRGDGTTVIKSQDDLFVVSNNKIYQHAEADLIISATNINETSTNTHTISATNLTIKSANVIINSDGSININGSDIVISGDIKLKGNVNVSGGSFEWNNKTVLTL